MSQNLDQIFKQIQKDSETIALNAMMSAANSAFKLAKQKADKCLENYLSRKPKIYKRKDTSPLSEAIDYDNPVQTVKRGRYTITFGLTYNPDKLAGQYVDEYGSHSWWHHSGDTWVSRFDNPDKFDFNSRANGVPNPEWILDNYLGGIHPGYNSTGKDYGWTDAESPSEAMTRFFEQELYEKAGSLIYNAMQGAILDFIKTNGGGK